MTKWGWQGLKATFLQSKESSNVLKVMRKQKPWLHSKTFVFGEKQHG